MFMGDVRGSVARRSPGAAACSRDVSQRVARQQLRAQVTRHEFERRPSEELVKHSCEELEKHPGEELVMHSCEAPARFFFCNLTSMSLWLRRSPL